MQQNNTKKLNIWLVPALVVFLTLTLTPSIAKILLTGAMLVLLVNALWYRTQTLKWALFFLTDAALLNLLQSGSAPARLLNLGIGLFITTLLVNLSSDGWQYSWATVASAAMQELTARGRASTFFEALIFLASALTLVNLVVVTALLGRAEVGAGALIAFTLSLTGALVAVPYALKEQLG